MSKKELEVGQVWDCFQGQRHTITSIEDGEVLAHLTFYPTHGRYFSVESFNRQMVKLIKDDKWVKLKEWLKGRDERTYALIAKMKELEL